MINFHQVLINKKMSEAEILELSIMVFVLFVNLQICIRQAIFNDIKKCYEFDKNLKVWDNRIQFKWKDISLGIIRGIYLKDFVYY